MSDTVSIENLLAGINDFDEIWHKIGLRPAERHYAASILHHYRSSGYSGCPRDELASVSHSDAVDRLIRSRFLEQHGNMYRINASVIREVAERQSDPLYDHIFPK